MAGDSYHHGALHEAILAAALEEARRSGPQSVQVRPLAKSVGVSPAAIYRHVTNIEALLAEVAQQARQEVAAHLIDRRDAAPKGRNAKDTARNRFRAIGRGYIDLALAEPHLFDTAFAPCTVGPPAEDDPSAWDVLVSGIQELIDAGIIPSSAGDRAALLAWAGVHGIASILVRKANAGRVDNDAAIDTVLDGVMRSIETL